MKQLTTFRAEVNNQIQSWN